MKRVAEDFLPLIEEALPEVGLKNQERVSLHVGSRTKEPPDEEKCSGLTECEVIDRARDESEVNIADSSFSHPSNLNIDFEFNNYVVGRSNELAFAT